MIAQTPPGSTQTPPTVDIFVLARLGLTLAFLAVTLLLISPFSASLTWAMVLSVIFLRPHNIIEKWVGPNIGAGISVFLIALIIVAPFSFASKRLIVEAMSGFSYLQNALAENRWQAFVAEHPWLQAVSDWVQTSIDLQDLVKKLGGFFTNAGAIFIRQSTGQLVTLLLAFYMLFFFLRDRKSGVAALLRLSPFSDRETLKLIVRVRDTINAIIFGTVAVAILQGALGGFMFWWLKFPSPALWALIMGLLSVVPVLGTFVVWVPAALYLAVDGRWGDALTLALWGGVVIASADNLVRPLLVSGGLRLSTAPAFIAMLGGLSVFGASGVVLGPIAMTTTSLMMSFWRRRAEAYALRDK
jgi:predicted PurR-regulated permease PerM